MRVWSRAADHQPCVDAARGPHPDRAVGCVEHHHLAGRYGPSTITSPLATASHTAL
jgi:hypothetical protein